MADPLSIAASIAGLVAIVGKVVEISHALCNQVTPQLQLLKRLVEQITDFHIVLSDLNKNYSPHALTADEQSALRQVSMRCEKTLIDLCDRLTTLRIIFAQGTAQRWWSAAKIKTALRDVEELRTDLAVSKLTLSIALNLRIANATQKLPNSTQVDQLHADILNVRAPLQQLLQSQPEHPIRQYIKASGDAARAALNEDTMSVRLFDSFSDWVDSLSTEDDVVEQPDATASPGSSANAEPSDLTRDTKAQFYVTNLGDAGKRKSEIVELAMTDFLQKAIDVLDEKGHHGICGFKFGDVAISPVVFDEDPVPIYITNGPSSYSPDWFGINLDEPLDDFYDNVFRTEESRASPLKLSIRHNQLKVMDTHSNRETFVSLNRTLRIPEDGQIYNQPALFGGFPLLRIDDVRDKLPESLARKGGVVMPMLPREAASIGISIGRESPLPLNGDEDIEPTRSSTLAMRVQCGGVNAVSGRAEREKAESRSPAQDYIVAPEQRRLDGFQDKKIYGPRTVRQFVTMPAGQGYSVEEQLNQEAILNGIQITIAPQFHRTMRKYEQDPESAVVATRYMAPRTRL
ncbi:hypothetical protein K4F52_001114 [Lecanicillium sp. MT-2017a]|nr:hypothetical protein K4F52_001114 [Lecanicillium sp. MT-2017a]